MASREDIEYVTRLVEEHSPALLAYFVRRVDDAEDAADLLSDLLTVVWRRVRTVPKNNIEARMWMYGVARRTLSTHRRGRRRRTALHERLRVELSVQTTAQSAEALDINAAIEALDPLDQEIIRLVHWDRLTQVEAGQLLGIPAATVRSRHLRARAQLRTLLDARPSLHPT